MIKPKIEIYESEHDGVVVVEIDTTELPEDSKGPIIRVYLNDEWIYENPVYNNSEEHLIKINKI